MDSSEKWLIRKAEEKDLPDITYIYNDAVLNSVATFDTEVKSIENRRQWLSQHSAMYPVLVAEQKERVIGWASLSRWSERAAYDQSAEASMYLIAEARNKGIGKELMQELLAAGKTGGLHTVLARITEGNEASIHLSGRLGFQTVGVLKEVGSKFGKLLDVTMMQVMLK